MVLLQHVLVELIAVTVLSAKDKIEKIESRLLAETENYLAASLGLASASITMLPSGVRVGALTRADISLP